MKYEVTSPDGRKLILEGDSAPTEQELENIFANYKPQDNYSALDKAKYMGRAGAEGLTFGLGDIVAGATNVFANDLADITHGKDLKTRLKGLGNSYYHALNPASVFNNNNFKQGRKEFVEEQEQFAQAHPWLNLGGELAGGLVTGIGSAAKGGVKALAKPTIGAMIKGGAKEGAKFGALYGLGSGLTEDADRLSVANALKGAGVGTLSGAVLGGALPVGIAGVVAGGKYLGRPLVTGGKKVADYFRNKTVNTLVGANKGLVEQSIKEGKPLIDIADQKLMDVAEGANLINREAKQTFADYGKARIEGQHPKLVDTLGQYFDPRGSHQLLDDLNAQVQEGAKTLYDKAKFVTDKAGNIVVDDAGKQVGKVLPELEKLNKYEMDYISQVYRTKGLEYEVQGLPQNDMRILDYAKQLMDDDIQQLLNKGKNRQAAILAEKRASFIAKIDKANPEYKTARNFFERGKRAENALQAGRSALSGERENLAYDFNKLTPEEKFYFRQGVGNKLEELSNQKTEGGNVFQKVFNAENRRRLKGLDIKNYADLEKTVLAESKAASNINSLRGGSPTADRLEAIKRFALGVIRRPTRTITNVLANTAFKPFYANPAEVAKAMTDPVFLSKLYAQAEKNGGKGAGRSVIEALNQIGRMAGGTAEEAQSNLNIRQIINDATKQIKNEGGFVRIKDLTDHYDNFSKVPREKRERIITNRLNKIVDEPIETGTKPYKMQVVKNNVKHIANANIDLNKNKKLRNQVALLSIKNIINKSKQNLSKSGKVDLTHNAPKTAKRKAEEVSKYVYFDRPVKIGDENFTVKMTTEQLRKQDPDLLNLYHINVKRNTTRAQSASEPSVPLNNSITQKTQNVKGSIKEILNSEGKPVAKTEEGTKNFNKILKKLNAQEDKEMQSNIKYDKNGKADINTPEFKNWSNNNKIVRNKDISNYNFKTGEGVVVEGWHGTNAEFEEFSPKMIGRNHPQSEYGFYFTDRKNNYGKKNMPVYLRFDNPLVVNVEDFSIEFFDTNRGDLVREAWRGNHDGIIVKSSKKADKPLFFVFEPTQIKSVYNKGTFDPKNPNIYKSLIGAGGLGSIAQILKNKENK